VNKGIFISDEARTSLNIFVSEDEFNELKKRLDQPITGTQKCYLTGKVCNHDEGLFVPSDNMADAIERNLQAAESVWKEFKNNIIICECGKKFKFETNDVLCPYCKKHINVLHCVLLKPCGELHVQ